MSHALYTARLSALSAQQSVPTVAQWAVGFAVAVTTWDTRWRTRKHLRKLSAQHLRDIGLDPLTAQAEAAKPFWRP